MTCMISPATEKAAQLRRPKGIYEMAPPRDQVVHTHLKSLSTAAYDTLKDVLKLPSSRTLKDYTHWIIGEPGNDSLYLQHAALHAHMYAIMYMQCRNSHRSVQRSCHQS